jgi:hypothetical protein
VKSPVALWLKPWSRARWVGKTILARIRYERDDGELLGQAQVWGVVVDARADWGLLIDLKGHAAGKQMSLPPDRRLLKPAHKGRYKLEATGEILTDPDYLCAVVLTLHDPDQAAGFDPADPPLPGFGGG